MRGYRFFSFSDPVMNLAMHILLGLMMKICLYRPGLNWAKARFSIFGLRVALVEGFRANRKGECSKVLYFFCRHTKVFLHFYVQIIWHLSWKTIYMKCHITFSTRKNWEIIIKNVFYHFMNVYHIRDHMSSSHLMFFFY